MSKKYCKCWAIHQPKIIFSKSLQTVVGTARAEIRASDIKQTAREIRDSLSPDNVKVEEQGTRNLKIERIYL